MCPAMGGVLGRVFYALVLLAVLGTASWISFSRFVQGKSATLPDLGEKTLEEAQALAGELGLTVEADATKAEFDDRIPAHQVRGQSPNPGTAVKAGQVVRVFLSLGPRTIRVPDLTGQSPRTAVIALRKEGLEPGAQSAVKVAGGAGVLGQGVLPGTVAAPSTPVDVLVNRGASDVAWVMPDLIGRDFEKVRLAFEVRGFRMGGVRKQAYEGAAAGTILRQFPLAGYPVTLRDTLSFVIAGGAEGAP